MNRFGIKLFALNDQFARIAHALNLRIDLWSNYGGLSAGTNQPTQLSQRGLASTDHKTRLPLQPMEKRKIKHVSLL
jgi:hypothetical protein